MPLLSRDALQTLIAGRNPQRGATAFVGSDGLPEPLCAIYEPATLAALQASIADGRSNVAGPRNLLMNTDIALLEHPASSIDSFNTRDELARLSASSGAVRPND
jgi:molybdopterin-guanine dinucleotide biosynthesis protein A